MPIPLLVLVPLAHAVDGPPRVTPRTPIGELRLLSGDVQLVYEELELKVLNLDEVEVRATYQVHNKGPELVVPYGVPITTGGPDGELRASEAAASVRVLSGGRFVPCLIEDGPELPLPHVELGAEVRHWCTADLVVPSGVSEVRLSYEGRMLFRRPAPKNGWEPVGANRKVLYSLAPGASWKGKTDTLSITFDAGPFGGSATVVGPRDPFQSGRITSWTLEKPDYAKLSAIEVDLAVSDRDRSANLFAQVAQRPESPEPTLVDGDLATPFCVTEPTTVDLTLPAPEQVGSTCSGGLLYVPGDRTTPDRWTATAPARLTLESCSGSGFQQTLPTTRSDAPETSGQAVALDSAVLDALAKAWARDQTACVRLSVQPRPTTEACLAELAAPVRCTP